MHQIISQVFRSMRRAQEPKVSPSCRALTINTCTDTNTWTQQLMIVHAEIEDILDISRYHSIFIRHHKNTQQLKTFRMKLQQSHLAALGFWTSPGKFFERLWRSWSMHSALPQVGSVGSVVESCWDSCFTKRQILEGVLLSNSVKLWIGLCF